MPATPFYCSRTAASACQSLGLTSNVAKRIFYTVQALFIAIFIIAISAYQSKAYAQKTPQFGPQGGGAVSAVVTTPYVRAELLAHAPQGVAPGQPLWLGLQIAHQPEWHTYWKNPGDSGLPTELTWTLPPGMTAGPVAWPAPHKIPLGNLMNYGYEGTVLLPVPVTVEPGFQAGPLARNMTVQLEATWLVCRKECIPETGRFSLKLPTDGTVALHGSLFAAAQAATPAALPAHKDSKARVDGNTLDLRVAGLPAAVQGKKLEFFPETTGVIETAAAWKQSWQGSTWTAQVPLSSQRSASPSPLPAVLVAPQPAATLGPASPAPTAWRIDLPVPQGWPAAKPMASVSPALEAALKANAQEASAAAAPTPPIAAPISRLTLGAALLGALLGGLLLNLMPCVLPVLAIKVMGFAQHGPHLRAQRLGGLAYTAGVVLSFMALGGLMLALRAAGQSVGWGFQLQSPAVVAGLAALFTLLALNLAGVFNVGHLLPSSVASMQARHPVADSFLTGVLAVAVASPCTAPFMGASLGLTATLPAGQALLIFMALGLGLALPYLAATWLPAVARMLPRPGAWMETLRQFMAFPMLATVVWLLWVLGQQTGVNGAMALLGLLLALALCAWALGCGGQSLRTRGARWGLGLFSLALMGVLAWGLLPRATRMLPPTSASAPTTQQGWQDWAPGLAEQLVAQNQAVFVDYTAAWCVTCQYNKRTTLSDPALLADFADRKVALLRADWTLRNPQITAALAALGRSGVPVYVLHRPGQSPLVLSEVLSVQEVRAALATLN